MTMMQKQSRLSPLEPCGCGGLITAATLAIAAMSMPAFGEDACEPHWSDEFPSGGGGPDSVVLAMASFDDGSGSALYVGGSFQTVGDVEARRVAKWDGQEWSPLGLGIGSSGSGPSVRALAVFDDGAGPALYVAGPFTVAGGKPASNIARWDGEAWSSVGSGLNDKVRALTVYDDGTGPALYAGGLFTEAGGVPANYIAKWDGETWSPLGEGMNENVSALTVMNDGDGESLIAGGAFTEAGGASANHIARWNGSKWQSIGAGFDDTVLALAGMDGEAGSTLVAGGAFTQSGDTPISRAAQWNGETWQPLGDELDSGVVFELISADIGHGPSLYAAILSPNLPSRVAQWDGESWVALGDLAGQGRVLHVFEDVAGPVLYVGGLLFTTPMETRYLLRWTGQAWIPPAEGITAESGAGAFAAAYFDDGKGEHLYVGGRFKSAGDLGVSNLLRWDGEDWTSIGTLSTPSSSNNPVYTLNVSDIDGVSSLYAGGLFTDIDGESFNSIGRWDGASWSPLAGGVSGGKWFFTSVFAIEEFDDGSGPILIVGGSFSQAGDVQASNIAAWDGENWHALGSGTDGIVNHMVVFDDGDGPSLYVIGLFGHAGGSDVGGLARWDGSQWHNVGSITASHWNHAPLAVHDGKLIVGDTVTLPGGESHGPVAVFDGESWTSWSEGYGWFPGWFETFDDGTGAALYAGVWVDEGEAEPMRALLKWDGTQWIVPDFGSVGNPDGAQRSNVSAMAVSAGGKEFAVGGVFRAAGDVVSPHVAILKGCPAPLPGDINGDGAVDADDLMLLLDAWGACPDPTQADCPADLNGDGVVDVSDLFILLANWT